MTARVLITARQMERFFTGRHGELEREGIELVIPNYPHPTFDEAALLKYLPGCTAVVAMPDPYSERVLAACAPPLKLIARSGVGYDSIDLDAAARHGVWVTTTPGSNHDTVADYTLALILCLLRDVVRTVNQTRQGVWQRVTGTELRGQTLGIVGTGRVGREVGIRAHAFGMRLLAHDLCPSTAWAERVGSTYVDLPTLFGSCDVITLHAPLTPETRYIVSREHLALVRPGALLVNTARGELVDEEALIEALDAGQVAGAALDVFAHEPPTTRRLIDHPKVIPTPHSAGGSREAQARAAAMIFDEVVRVVRGEPPLYPINTLR